MAMQKIKLEASEEYKDAVKQRESEIFRKQANEIVKEAQNQKNAATRKRSGVLARRQKRVDDKRAEINSYINKLDKAQKIIDEKFYTLIATITLSLFMFACIMCVVMIGFGYRKGAIIAVLLCALVLIVISTHAQTTVLDAEKDVKNYKAKISVALQELKKLETLLGK